VEERPRIVWAREVALERSERGCRRCSWGKITHFSPPRPETAGERAKAPSARARARLNMLSSSLSDQFRGNFGSTPPISLTYWTGSSDPEG